MCLWKYKGTKKGWYILNNGIFFSCEKEGNLPFGTTWRNLEKITLSEMSQGRTNTVWHHSVSILKKPDSDKLRVEWGLPGAGEWGK